jgi:hypothetical protein
MNKTEAAKLLALIKVAYPSTYKDMDDKTKIATVTMWQSTFANVPYAIVEMAFDHFRRVSKFAPTIADMYDELKGLHYRALEEVATTDDNEVRAIASKIMQHTSQYKYGDDGAYNIASHLPKLQMLPERIDDNGG